MIKHVSFKNARANKIIPDGTTRVALRDRTGWGV